MREKLKKVGLLLLVGIISAISPTFAQQYVLTPPYFNIAENRPITANATCGEGTTLQRPERFCKLVGFDLEAAWGSDRDKEILYGQVCDYCYAPNTEGVDITKTHGPKNAVDGDISTAWQSPPISRGRKYNRVDLEIDLLQTFQVAYVVVTMADSPRPGVWALEKSLDGGKNWKAWQYFAGNDAECQRYFGMHANMKIMADDDVTCITEFSKVLPIEGGEIFIPLTQGRPSEDDIQNSDVMMNWLRATNIRLRLMQTKTMLGHLMSVAQGDQSITRRYYYSIKEISVGGRCVCNGHAYVCPPSPLDPNILQCECLHNTAGLNCDQCAPGFTQKEWRRYTKDDPFLCEKCNCNGHSEECHFDQETAEQGLSMDMQGNYEGGGVCDACRDFTTGINCHTCVEGYFRPVGVLPNATNPCVPCDCGGDPYDRYTGSCEAESGQCECKEAYRGAEDCSACATGFYGYPECKPCDCFSEGTLLDESGIPYCVSEGKTQCPCKENYGGQFCDECAPGYYNFPDCIPCECQPEHSLDLACDQFTGQCSCDKSYGNRTCEACSDGFYNYPDCSDCNCDPQGTEAEICDKVYGECICKEGYGGARCDKCLPGWYGYPECKQCECSEEGSNNEVCDEVSGQCPCFSNYGGRKCDSCTPGYYSYPDCKMCGCNNFGSVGSSCDSKGHCSCLTNFMGIKCDTCALDRFNFPLCEECNCDPKGVADDFFLRGGCASVPKGELCSCKEMVTGRTCNRCKPLYWNLQKWRPDGCEACDCNRNGTIGRLGVCDIADGQCACKPAVDGSRKCDACKDGFFQLSGNSMLGCESCNCDLGGTDHRPGETPSCDKEDGQCNCRYGMIGRRCNTVQPLHYVPNLYQHKFEVEDGYRTDGSLVRFAYDPAKFPNFSWRGYAAYSPLQKRVLQDISLTSSSLYQMVLRYQNPNGVPISGTVKMNKADALDDSGMIYHKFVLDPTAGDPMFVTVSGEAGIYPSPFDLEPGQWTVTLEVDNNDGESQEVLIDYFVLLPTEYTEPRILRQDIRDPCLRDGSQDFCREYVYPVADQFSGVDSKDAMNPSGAGFYPYTGPAEDIERVGADHVVQIANFQPELKWTDVPSKGGAHVVVLGYFTPNPMNGTKLGVSAGEGRPGEVYIYDCPYNTVCRQVVTDPEGRISTFILPRRDATVSVRALAPDTDVAIDKIYLIPLDKWNTDYITPFSKCIKDRAGKCMTPQPFPVAPDNAAIFIPGYDEAKQQEQGVPRFIAEADVPLAKIGGSHPTAVLTGNVLQEGAYVIVAQYYQPDHSEIMAKVTITDGKQRAGGDQLPEDIFNVYEAVLPLPNCASPTGCRQTVMTSDDHSKPDEFLLTETVDIKFEATGPEGAWIEYVLAVPHEEFDLPLLVADDTVDRRREFVKECGRNDFYVPDTVEDGFCKESITTVSADFNNGALSCECDAEGSNSQYECQPFGGQCDCKPNVIGQSCTRCAPGYFGFPNCQQCSCPSTATCDETTGECICAPFVTGTKENPCSQCEENTFGYDPITGCQECKCNIDGTIGGNMTCTQESGQCYCEQNVEGRTCDHCSYGSYLYPTCETCDCDVSGTTEKICDQANAECLCKPYVTGQRCDTCKDGHFNLQDNNPDGCTECFCFGKTTFCSSAPNLKRIQIDEMSGWTGATVLISRNPEITSTNMEPLTNYGGILDMDFLTIPDADLENQVFYFDSPPAFSGSKINSYGSQISYNISFYGDTDQGSKKAPDVILKGGDSIIFFFSGRKVNVGERVSVRAQLEPRYWVHPSGNPVSRPQLMVILNNLEKVYVRGAYGGTSSQQTRLENVVFQQTEETTEALSDPVLTVEKCLCPEGYTGDSCELCSPGYWSGTTDKWGPICRRCDCNGHADTCHPTTGECATYKPKEDPESLGLRIPLSNFCHFRPELCEVDTTVVHCKDNTRGPNCEQCEVGFYGDATLGTPDACRSCPCPLPDNNFATSCDGLFNAVDPEQQVCVCESNYVGDRCQQCGPGYFGNPEEVEGYCQPCSCNGNINTTDPVACNHLTGICQLCLGNSFGDSCERCEPWYYGDAINNKDCRECDCDRDGTEVCDHNTGQCKCFPGVEGERCDQCMADHFGFKFGGCTDCKCSEASEDTQCDLLTGQCRCKPGVTGGKCSRCLNGFWNLGPNGCESCGCNTDFAVGGGCNQITGQCECLPGVIGQNCDRCPPNWVLIMNETRTDIPAWKMPFGYDEGCFPCSSCVGDLMDTANAVVNGLAPIMEEFKETEKSFFAFKRLNFIGSEIDRLKPEIALLNPTEGNNRVAPLEQAANDLHWEAKSLNVDFKQSLMEDLSSQAEDLSVDGSNAVAEMGEVGIKILEVINDVNAVSEYLGEGASQELLDKSIKTGRELLSAMQGRDFAEARAAVVQEQENTRNLVDRVNKWSEPVNVFKDNVKATNALLEKFESNLMDLEDQTKHADQMATEANQLNFQNSAPQAQDKIAKITQLTGDSESKTTDGNTMVTEAETFNNEAKAAYTNLDGEKDDMDESIVRFSDRQRNFDTERENLFNLEGEAAGKARDLSMSAQELQSVAERAKYPAENALQAAKAYEQILDSVTQADEATREALASAEKALDMSDGVANKVTDALRQIEGMYDDAQNAKASVDNELGPKLEADVQLVSVLTDQTKKLKQDLDTVAKQVEKMGDLSDTIEDTKQQASNAQTGAHDALTSINARASEISQNKEKAYGLRNTHSEMRLSLDNTEKALQEYDPSPAGRKKREAYQNYDINTRLTKLEERKEYMLSTGNRVDDLVQSIKAKIGSAREALAQINNPGMTFSRGSNLEVETPAHIEDLSLKTDVEFYVNVSNSGADNERDFLFYMGNLEETYKKIPNSYTDDYMAVQVGKEGYVTLTMDLGAGPLEMQSHEPISYNDWVKIGVARHGYDVNLTVSSELEVGNIHMDVVSDQLPFLDGKGRPFGSVFNLNREFSKVYVGGFPTDSKVQSKITSTDMEGQIEGLRIGGKPVGLWNLKNSAMISGASARNKFAEMKDSEARFDGSGYISVDPTDFYTEGQTSSISLRIRPERANGLIFLLVDQVASQYIALELQEGILTYRFAVGPETVEIRSSQALDMMSWYNVKIERQGMIGVLSVDGRTVGEDGNLDAPGDFALMTSLFISGTPVGTNYPAMREGFAGCISHVKIGPDHVDLEHSLESINALPSCAVETSATLSFSEGNPGYVKMPSAVTNGSLTFSFMFRTGAMNGLLMYLVDSADMFYVSLSMQDGALYLYAHPDNELMTQDLQNNPTRFNDNAWHVVSVSISSDPENRIMMHLDDNFIAVPHEVSNIPLVVDGTQYNIYYGGLPERLRPLRSGVSQHEGPFIGCIRDAIVVNNYQDFNRAESMAGAALGECGSSDFVTIEPTAEPAETEEAEESAVEEYDPKDLYDANAAEQGQGSSTYGECKLPTSPAYDTDLSAESGMRFGIKADSFIEFIKKALPDQMKEKSRFDLEFKTSKPDGLILFMKDTERTDFFAVYIKDGRLVFSFDCGSGPSKLETDFRVDDDVWHSVDVSRIENEGKLVFDSREVKVPDQSRFSFSSTKILEVSPNLYLGGLDNAMKTDPDIKRKLEFGSDNTVPGFVGCLRQIRFEVTGRNGKRRMRSLGKWQKNSNVIPCSEKVEQGYFFGPKGGRVKAFRRFRVGIDFDVSMMIKPRNISGLLLAVRGRRDSAILQMVDGAIQFVVDNGRGPISAVFKPDDQFQFCNGEWHEIQAVKAKNVVTLSVNKIFAQPGIGVVGVSSTDTNNPLFLGGHPYPKRLRIDSYTPYVGCMRDVVIEGEPVVFRPRMLDGDIHSHVCPLI